MEPALAHLRKAFFDMTGSHWMKQSLSGKPAATFVSTGTQNGGQELTHMQTLSCALAEMERVAHLKNGHGR